jgi:hypothetical protein
MRATTFRRGAAAVALGLGTLAMASSAGAYGAPTNPWAGHGSEHIEACGDGGTYHWVLNQYTGTASAFRIDGQAPSKITPGTVHWHIEMDEPVIGDVEVTGGNVTGGLVLSGCEPGDYTPPS